jgi:hypothetical protein
MILNVSPAASDVMLDSVGNMLDGENLELLSPDGGLLVTLRLSDAGPAIDGEFVFKVADGTAVQSGEAHFACGVAADGTEVFSCDCGDENSDAVIKLKPTRIDLGSSVSLSSFRLIMP